MSPTMLYSKHFIILLSLICLLKLSTSLAFAQQANGTNVSTATNSDIPQHWLAQVQASSGQTRFRCDVESYQLGFHDLTPRCYHSAPIGRLLYLVDTGNDNRIVGVAKVTGIQGEKTFPTVFIMEVVAGNMGNISQLAHEKRLVLLSAQSLELQKTWATKSAQAGALIAPKLWYGFMHGASEGDTLDGLLYGLSVSGKYKGFSLGADVLFNLLEREILEQSGLSGRKLDASIYVLGMLKQQLSDNWFLRSDGMWGSLYGNEGNQSTLFYGDLVVAVRAGDYLMTGFGYRYVNLTLPGEHTGEPDRNFQEHTGLLGIWDPSMIGYGKQGLTWSWDFLFYFGATPNDQIAGGNDTLIYLVYIGDAFQARLGYRVMVNFVAKKKTEAEPNASGPEFYTVIHGPFLEIGYFWKML